MNYETRVDLGDSDSQGQSADDFADDVELDPRAARKRSLIKAAAIAVAAILGVALVFGGGDSETAFAPEDDVAAPRVTVISPGANTVQGYINATGTLAARREMPVGVVGEGGRVVSVPVEAGDWVRAGQVLAVIDRSVQQQQTASAAAQVEVAAADADLAQANLDRAAQLVERGFISQADIDRLTATRDAALARHRVAQAQLAERQARNAQLNIVAPAAGLLLTRDVEPGQVVGGGAGTLFSIARGGELELLAMVDEGELAAIPIGATGVLTPVGTDQSFTCQIWQKSPTINELTRQGTARCALPYNPALRPGGFAAVQLNSGASVAPILPESAILSDEGGPFVRIANAENRVERRDVELGMISDQGIVIAAGLDGSERIVARAAGFLTEGELIVPVVAEATD